MGRGLWIFCIGSIIMLGGGYKVIFVTTESLKGQAILQREALVCKVNILFHLSSSGF